MSGPKPCPFCGSNRTKSFTTGYYKDDKKIFGIRNKDGVYSYGSAFHVICIDCETQGPFAWQEDVAIKYWNGMVSMYGSTRDIADLYTEE